jgi:hypothetical protein
LIRIYQDKKWFDCNLMMLSTIIEKARLENPSNPPVPDWLQDDYTRSLYRIAEYAFGQLRQQWDYATLLGVLMLVTLLQKQIDLAELLNLIDEGQASSIIERL